MVYKVTCHSTCRYCKALQLKSTINALDLIIFCQKRNIDLVKFFLFFVFRKTLTFMQQSKERETRENEEKRKETKKLHKSLE